MELTSLLPNVLAKRPGRAALDALAAQEAALAGQAEWPMWNGGRRPFGTVVRMLKVALHCCRMEKLCFKVMCKR